MLEEPTYELPVTLSQTQQAIIEVPNRGTMAIVVKTMRIPASGFDVIIPPTDTHPGVRQPKHETYMALGQAKGMRYSIVSPMSIERVRNKIQSVSGTLKAEYIGVTGEPVEDVETFFLDMDDFINEEMKKKCMKWDQAKKKLVIDESKIKIVRDESGIIIDVVYMLSDVEAAQVFALCERRRTMLPRLFETKIRNRLVRRATGVGSLQYDAESANKPVIVNIFATVVLNQAKSGQEQGLYSIESPKQILLPEPPPVVRPPRQTKDKAAQDPSPTNATTDAPSTAQPATEQKPTSDRTICSSCGRQLSKRGIEYYANKPNDKPLCYDCDR